jgi:hypothetical protein
MDRGGGGMESDRMALRPRLGDMQERLFGVRPQRAPPLSDAAVQRVLRDLRAAPELRFFRIWLVGSRVEPGAILSDIDVVLSPRAGVSPDGHLIEYALWHCRAYGLYKSVPPCVIDPCFRHCGPTIELVPLEPQTIIRTVKLLSPWLEGLVGSARITEHNRVGEISIEFVRRAVDTEYYGKLPQGKFSGGPCAYLRPASEIAFADGDRGLHAIPGRLHKRRGESPAHHACAQKNGPAEVG